MKKFTLLLLLIPFFGFAQTWDFTNTDDGWNEVNTTSTIQSDYWELTSISGETKPGMKLDPVDPAIDVTAVHVLAITMKNKSATGPGQLKARVSTDVGHTYRFIGISKGDTEYQTYYTDLSGTNWDTATDGTMIKIQFYNTDGSEYTGTGNEVFDIDKIEMLSELPITERNVYNFNTEDDEEGFTALNGSLAGPASGLLLFTPAVDQYAKIDQVAHYVDATNKFIHISLKNTSPLNDQLRLLSAAFAGPKTMEISVSDATVNTYTFDLTGEADWTGEQMFIVGIGSLATEKTQDDGIVEFDSIVFDNSAAVEGDEIVSFSLNPNPAKETLFINSSHTVSSIVIFDITGKQVLQLAELTNNQVNISNLNPGVYMVKVGDNHNNYTTQKLVISK